jgi:hypothetical protein
MEMDRDKPQYEYDVFISYAHADFSYPFVGGFNHHLQAELALRLGRQVLIFQTKGPGSDVGTISKTPQQADILRPQTLIEALHRSAVILFLLSRRFIKRPWFEIEWTEFSNSHHGGLTPLRSRRFGVLLDKIDPTKLPEAAANEMTMIRFGRGEKVRLFQGTSEEFPYMDAMQELARAISDVLVQIDGE